MSDKQINGKSSLVKVRDLQISLAVNITLLIAILSVKHAPFALIRLLKPRQYGLVGLVEVAATLANLLNCRRILVVLCFLLSERLLLRVRLEFGDRVE